MGVRRKFGLGILVFTVLLVGCGDKEKEARSKAQQAEIAALKHQVELLTAKLGKPEEGDPEEDLAKAKEALEEATGRVEALRNELAALTKQRSELEKEFDEYQKNYKIPE